MRCNYLRDVRGLQSHLNSHYHNTDLSLAQMLTDFFQFYSDEFDYSRDAACIITGEIQVKTVSSHQVNAVLCTSSLSIVNLLSDILYYVFQFSQRNCCEFKHPAINQKFIITFLHKYGLS